MSSVKVSIIVPVYKTPLEYLRACFNSFIAQTMRECEFIVVSDGAPEAECSVCEEYASKDKRFKFSKQEHAGVSATRNYGIEKAQGEYITFVDADDWIEPETCKITYFFAKQNNSDIVFWDLFLEKPGKERVSTEFCCQDIKKLSKKDISTFCDSIIHCPNRNLLVPPLTVCKLIKRNCIQSHNIKFDSRLSRGEDRVFNFQIMVHTDNVAYLKKTLYHYIIHASSTEQSFHKHDFSNLLKFIQQLDLLSEHKKRVSIANETIECFFRCIYKLYHSDLSKKQICSELFFLKNQIKTEPFHMFIQKAYFPKYSFFARLEINLMKKGITIFSTLRIIKIFCLGFHAKILH